MHSDTYELHELKKITSRFMNFRREHHGFETYANDLSEVVPSNFEGRWKYKKKLNVS